MFWAVPMRFRMFYDARGCYRMLWYVLGRFGRFGAVSDVFWLNAPESSATCPPRARASSSVGLSPTEGEGKNDAHPSAYPLQAPV